MVRVEGPPVHGLSVWFAQDPTIGVCLLSLDLKIRFVNRRAADLYLPGSDSAVVGTHLSDHFPPEFVAERRYLIGRICEDHTPRVLRSIIDGQRVQCTFHPFFGDSPDPCCILGFTIAGEADLDVPDGRYEIVESEVVDLGLLDRLTRREIEVLALIGHGMGRERIARHLFRSAKTVDNHMAAITTKLGAANRSELVIIAKRAGLRLEHADKTRADFRDRSPAH